MKYTDMPGAIYDTDYWFIAYFNPETREYRNTAAYEEIKANLPKVPEVFAPLFSLFDGGACAFSRFFCDSFDFCDDDGESFARKINERRTRLYELTLERLFCLDGGSIPKTPSETVDAIKALSYDDGVKLNISCLLFDFDRVASLLAEWFIKVYEKVRAYHERRAEGIKARYELIASDEGFRRYEALLKFDRESFDGAFVSISLLNTEIVYCSHRSPDALYLLLGENSVDLSDDERKTEAEAADGLLLALGNKTRVGIFRALCRHGEMNLTELAAALGCPMTTLCRNIEILSDNGIIYISRRQGLKIYYRLNAKQIKRAAGALKQMFDSIE